MKEEQKRFESLDASHLSVRSLKDQANVARHSYSCDMPKIRIYSDVLEDQHSGSPVEIRNAVQCPIIVWTLIFVLILAAVLVIRILMHLHNPEEFPVLCYVLIPFGIWLITSLSFFIFKWSNVWKRSYSICSTAFAFGTTLFITLNEIISESSQERILSRIEIRGIDDMSKVVNVMFCFYCFVLLCLLWPHLCLLWDYIKHKQKRMLPDLANGCHYLPLSGNTSGDETKSNRGIFLNRQNSSSLSNSEQSTLKRQAVYIPYLEEQVKVLLSRLKAQQFTSPVSKS